MDWVVFFMRTLRGWSRTLIASYFFVFFRFSSFFPWSINFVFWHLFSSGFLSFCIQPLLFILDIYRQWRNAPCCLIFYYFPVCRVEEKKRVKTTQSNTVYKSACCTTFMHFPNWYAPRSVFIGILSPDVCAIFRRTVQVSSYVKQVKSNIYSFDFIEEPKYWKYTQKKTCHKKVICMKTGWMKSLKSIFRFDDDDDDASVIRSYRISGTRSITSYKFIISHQYVRAWMTARLSQYDKRWLSQWKICTTLILCHCHTEPRRVLEARKKNGFSICFLPHVRI